MIILCILDLYYEVIVSCIVKDSFDLCIPMLIVFNMVSDHLGYSIFNNPYVIYLMDLFISPKVCWLKDVTSSVKFSVHFVRVRRIGSSNSNSNVHRHLCCHDYPPVVLFLIIKEKNIIKRKESL